MKGEWLFQFLNGKFCPNDGSETTFWFSCWPVIFWWWSYATFCPRGKTWGCYWWVQHSTRNSSPRTSKTVQLSTSRVRCVSVSPPPPSTASYLVQRFVLVFKCLAYWVAVAVRHRPDDKQSTVDSNVGNYPHNRFFWEPHHFFQEEIITHSVTRKPNLVLSNPPCKASNYIYQAYWF